MSTVDKDLLKKYHLEEAQKRFQQITEYTFITKPLLGEDGEDDGQEQPQGDAQQQQQMPPQQPQGGNQGIPAPQGDMNAQQPPVQDNGGNEMSPMGNMPPQDGGMPEPMGDGNVDTMQDGDEVIDVDELTQAQETTDVKIDGVNDKLQNLLNVTTRFIAAVQQNNAKIEDLKAEFERRNPTEEERINIRSQASAPYTETPKDFWDRKSQNSNYNVIYNNEVDPDKEEKEYIIRRGDINSNDNASLAKSLDYPSKLEDFVNF